MSVKQQILICDDQHIIHETLGVYLRNEGFECISAFDGEQAIEEFNRKKPNLVILDLMMPKKAEWTFAARFARTAVFRL